MQIAVGPGTVIGVGFVLPPAAGPFTRARVLVVGDLVRRVLEDIQLGSGRGWPSSRGIVR